MIVQCVTPQQYHEAFPSSGYIYDSTEFCLLNSANATNIVYAIGYYEPGRPLLGITAGFDGQTWKCPFSAPYGFIVSNGELQLGDIYDFFSELTHVLGATLKLTLPPALHTDSMWSKVVGTLNSLCRRRTDDFNYHIALPATAETLPMSAAARRNLRRAIKSDLRLIQTDDVTRVYDIIAEHHRLKGYHMAMTCQAVADTAKVVRTDMFVVTHQDADIAAVYLHHVCDDTAQLINWGALPQYNSLRPMNFMAVRLAEHYSELGLKHLDLGPASTAGIPNAGLCRFKEEVGGITTLKPTFVI